jgi:hypothetical protein
MKPVFVASFDREEALLQAVQAVRASGWQVRDICTPYPVHGLDQLMGLKRSWLPRACFVFGLVGVTLALSFQYWASTWDWPINVGSRPWNALPAFVPVTFEAMVLFAGLGLVLTWLIVCRLYPGKSPVPLVPQASNDRFALILEEGSGQPSNLAAIRQLLQDCQAISIEEQGQTELQ